MTPLELLGFCREKDVKAVDFRFVDFPGIWQHFTIPIDKLEEDCFEDSRFRIASYGQARIAQYDINIKPDQVRR